MIPQIVARLLLASLIGLIASEIAAAPDGEDVKVSRAMSILFAPETLSLEETNKLLSAISWELGVKPESAGRSGLTKEMIDELLKPQRFLKLHCDYPHMLASRNLATSPAGRASASLRNLAIAHFLDCKSVLDDMINMEVLSEKDQSVMKDLLEQVAGDLAFQVQPEIVEFVTKLDRAELVKKLVQFLLKGNGDSSSIVLYRKFERIVEICSAVAGDLMSSIGVYEPFLVEGMPAYENGYARRWLATAKLCKRIVEDEKNFKAKILDCYDTNCAQ